MLTRRQQQVLDYIKLYMANNDGIAPSFDEIRHGCGMTSKSGVYRVVEALAERGHIRRMRERARAIELIDDPHLPVALNDATIGEIAGECFRRGYAIGRWELHREKLGEGYIDTVHFREVAPQARRA